MFTGYCVPIPLKSENSETIAMLLDSYIFKVFGPPKVISSDNAANLSGPPVQNLLRFYNVIHRKTTPYHPQSHGLIEVTNRNITRLLKIFTEQFKATWHDVLTLATIMANTVPRPVLQNHSPYFLMFGHEFDPEEIPLTDLIDVSDYAEKTLNNLNFAQLLREYLLKHRRQINQSRARPYKSFPKDSLIYIKDFSKTGNRKLKPVFKRIPLKVIKEYRATVYAIDFQGRISKHSKDNIKLAGPRSLQLFEQLPEKVKLALGGPLDKDNWDEVLTKGNIPDYFKEYELDFEPANTLRGQLPEDTHLLQQENQELGGNQLDDDDEDWTRLDPVVSDLKELHDIGQLGGQLISWSEFEKKRKELREKEIVARENRIAREVDAANILPDNSKRRVRFKD
jgi:hypothetical protein